MSRIFTNSGSGKQIGRWSTTVLVVLGAVLGSIVSWAGASPVGARPGASDGPSPVARQRSAGPALAPGAAGRTSAAVPRAATDVPVLRSWEGVSRLPLAHAPSDSTSAVGTSRFIEVTNDAYAIYDRVNDVPLDTQAANVLVESASGRITDPQILWDAGTERFYYSWLQIESSTDNRIAFGFSRTGSPNGGTGADWCKYSIRYGSQFPDFAKLGDTQDFLLFGSNVFGPGTTGSFLRSDVQWVAKPGPGTACPATGSLLSGVKADLRQADGSPSFTPVPANQTDPSGSGWVVATAPPPALPATIISLYQVTRDPTTGAAVFGGPRSMPVPAYDEPNLAPQPGTNQRLDTLDARLTQAVSSVDPSRGAGSSVAIWTQHTVRGGAGAEVRWYEIDPATSTTFQSGRVTDPNLFVFNGSVSSDRKVNGPTAAFGSNMVLGFNTSSSAQQVDFRVASNVAGGPLSEPTRVAVSSGSITTTCEDPSYCRWGDYAGATPDPGAPSTGAVGQVWLTNQLGRGGSERNWTTWNAVAAPVGPSPVPFAPLTPARLWDSRFGPGPTGRIGPGGTRDVTVTGTGGVPASGVTAVVLNVTAVGASAGTYVTAWPTGEGRPLASNLNVPPGDTRPNLVVVKVGAGGQVSFYNDAGTLDLIADVAGWYGPGASQRFVGVSPSRVWDTRFGPGPTGRMGAEETRQVAVTGLGGVPATGVTAVVLNVTAVDPSAGTFVTAWPSGETRPLASNLNVPPGDTRPNLVVVKVGDNGRVSFSNNAGSVDLIADVAGWYGAGGAGLTSVSPARLWDTRSGPGPTGRIGAGERRDITVTGTGGVPTTGVTAVVLNVTAVNPSAATFVTVWPAGEPRPLASNLNVPPGDTRPNLVVVKVGAGGQVSFSNDAGGVDLIADVAGWYGPTSS